MISAGLLHAFFSDLNVHKNKIGCSFFFFVKEKVLSRIHSDRTGLQVVPQQMLFYLFLFHRKLPFRESRWKLSVFITARNHHHGGPRRPAKGGITSKPEESTNGQQSTVRFMQKSHFLSALAVHTSFRNLSTFNRSPPLIGVHLLSGCQCSFPNKPADCRRKRSRAKKTCSFRKGGG